MEEAETQGVLGFSEQKESSGSNDSPKNKQSRKEEPSLDDHPTKLYLKVVKAIERNVNFNNSPKEVMGTLDDIWYLCDEENELSNSTRVRLIVIGIDTNKNKNLTILKNQLRNYWEHLDQEEELKKIESWTTVREEIRLKIIRYANKKIFTPPTLKDCYNDWSIWILVIIARITMNEYSFEDLKDRILCMPQDFPLRWSDPIWDNPQEDVFRYLLLHCPPKRKFK
ncbi:hypothetical protein NEAUS03_2499 [Nematocida ausubeli]|nr:hypothetical protein NEAUS03_2499 [Nematocida ausubeli]